MCFTFILPFGCLGQELIVKDDIEEDLLPQYLQL